LRIEKKLFPKASCGHNRDSVVYDVRWKK